MHRTFKTILFGDPDSPPVRTPQPQPQSSRDRSLTVAEPNHTRLVLTPTGFNNVSAQLSSLREQISRQHEASLEIARIASEQSEARHRQTHLKQDNATAQLTSLQQSAAAHEVALRTMREEQHREQKEEFEATRQALQNELASATPADVQPLQKKLNEVDRMLVLLKEARRFPKTPGRSRSCQSPSRATHASRAHATPPPFPQPRHPCCSRQMMALRKKEDAEAEVTQQTVVEQLREALQEELAMHQVGIEADAAAAARKVALQTKGAAQVPRRGAPAMQRGARGGGPPVALPRVATLGSGGARGGGSRFGAAAAAAPASASSRAPPRNQGVLPQQPHAAARRAAARRAPAQPQRYKPTSIAPPLGYAAPSEYPGPSQHSPHEMLAPLPAHGGTADANGALGGSFNTSGYSSLELPAEKPRAVSAQDIIERTAAAKASRMAAKLAAANCEVSRAAAAASGAKVAASAAADENRRPNGQCPNPNLFERPSTLFSR